MGTFALAKVRGADRADATGFIALPFDVDRLAAMIVVRRRARSSWRGSLRPQFRTVRAERASRWIPDRPSSRFVFEAT
ncbi:hypothetical protein [Paeniglutamicibacter psychrophenolicus]|uniref:hypothetical protein n=1 Tax=Paeniglutamicibacter psychrophenolicus TaxID=257454 RepID=UPI00278879A0|nr:hypothetical protein [Paeniglutamicibacter psychrophenolicus]MDQ0093570.1 hypothetical protein [Paeniglutamicibacter psychrophenolicus]